MRNGLIGLRGIEKVVTVVDGVVAILFRVKSMS